MKKTLSLLATIILSFSFSQIVSAAFITIDGNSDGSLAREVQTESGDDSASSTIIHGTGEARAFTDTFTISVDEGVNAFSEYAFTFLAPSSVTLFKDGTEAESFDAASGKYTGSFLFEANTTYTVVVKAEIEAQRSATSALSIEGRADIAGGGGTAGSGTAGSSATPDGVSEVPVPAAVWLFSSAILGLAGFSRKKKA
jgi:hypothetical protein